MADEIAFRRAREADVVAEHEVLTEAEGGVMRRHGYDAPETPLDGFARTHAHLLEHDGERSFVAEAEGAVVGYSAAIVRGDTWFLSSLFIRERYQGRGIGRRLLELSWGEGHARRITIPPGSGAGRSRSLRRSRSPSGARISSLASREPT